MRPAICVRNSPYFDSRRGFNPQTTAPPGSAPFTALKLGTLCITLNIFKYRGLQYSDLYGLKTARHACHWRSQLSKFPFSLPVPGYVLSKLNHVLCKKIRWLAVFCRQPTTLQVKFKSTKPSNRRFSAGDCLPNSAPDFSCVRAVRVYTEPHNGNIFALEKKKGRNDVVAHSPQSTRSST